MEKEIFGGFNLGTTSGPDIQMQDVEEVKLQEEKLKRSSTTFLFVGLTTLVAAGALAGLATGLIGGSIGNLFGAAVALGIGGLVIGGISLLRRVFTKNTLNFPALKLKRKTAEAMAGTSTRPFAETTFAGRKLSKSDANKVFFGVCSGLAEYAGVAPSLMRLAFILAFFFSGGAIILPYIILAIALPAIRRREEGR